MDIASNLFLSKPVEYLRKGLMRYKSRISSTMKTAKTEIILMEDISNLMNKHQQANHSTDISGTTESRDLFWRII